MGLAFCALQISEKSWCIRTKALYCDELVCSGHRIARGERRSPRGSVAPSP